MQCSRTSTSHRKGQGRVRGGSTPLWNISSASQWQAQLFAAALTCLNHLSFVNNRTTLECTAQLVMDGLRLKSCGSK